MRQIKSETFPPRDVARLWIVALALAASCAVHAATVRLHHGIVNDPPAGAKDIVGVVTGPNGPEAGVWVIAETTELPTKMARIVVTDDQGRYVIPDLPTADYQVWVRGYGLVDSPRFRGKPGQVLNLRAVVAPDAASAAHYYPAIYWLTMMKIPPASDFGGSTGIPKDVTRTDWLALLNNGFCIGCHQIGQEATRTLPAGLGTFHSSEEAWIRRLQSGQAGVFMTAFVARFGGEPYKYFADWTDRIASGELPKTKPARPKGIERNLVITWWEWSTPNKYLHDLVSTDRRYPTVNAYGRLYGSPEYSTDNMPILDPRTNQVSHFKIPVRDPDMPVGLGDGHIGTVKPLQPSAYWGDETLWDSRAINHNAMFGKDGRLWLAAAVRDPRNPPPWCKKGSHNPYAEVFTPSLGERQVGVLDPKTGKYQFIDTCFATHHLQFGYDRDNTLWFSGTGDVAGWLDTRVFDQTGSAEKAQGWAPFVLDLVGDGKLHPYVEPDQPPQPGKDKRIVDGYGPYAVMPSPVDGSVWYTIGISIGQPAVLRFDPKTKLSEIYYLPKKGVGLRGGDIDSQGVVWVSAANGSLASFDRRKCKGPLNGPTATGNQCPEGWTFYRYPGPGFEGETNSAEASYYTWVDQHDTLGLGNDIPISTADLEDGFVALKDGHMIMLRIPYPLGFYAKGLDGRIDDPNGGWKGRGLWSTSGDRAPWMMETGKGTRPIAVHIQLRPSPLAR
jgi:hypothetical protein